MSEENKEILTEEVVIRKNNFCVIKIEPNKNGWHDLQSNSSWRSNPYGDEFVEVEDELVPSILETCGYCDITLNEEGTKCIAFVATEKPEISEPEPEPTEDELQWQAITDLEIEQMETSQALTDLEISQLEG